MSLAKRSLVATFIKHEPDPADDPETSLQGGNWFTFPDYVEVLRTHCVASDSHTEPCFTDKRARPPCLLCAGALTGMLLPVPTGLLETLPPHHHAPLAQAETSHSLALVGECLFSQPHTHHSLTVALQNHAGQMCMR